MMAVGVVLLAGALAARAESRGPRMTAAPAPGTSQAVRAPAVLPQTVLAQTVLAQTVLVWFPDTRLELNPRAALAAEILLPFVLFFAMGYIWQALDEEEFPDSELPAWFVSAFRGRNRGLVTGPS